MNTYGLRIAAVLVGLFCATMPNGARAYELFRCANGTARSWKGSGVTLPYIIDTRSIPVGSVSHGDVTYAFGRWNDIDAMRALFSFRNCNGTASDCSAVRGDGKLTVAYDPALAGAGVTLIRYNTSTCAISDADVIVGPDLVVGNPACDADPNTYTGHRSTLIHEMGHALGLEHEDNETALMMSTDGEGIYCGAQRVTPHPDDRQGGRALYPGISGTLTNTDLGASASYRIADDDMQPNMSPGVTTLCPGQTLTVRYSVGNLGTSTINGYNVGFYLSTNTDITTGDTFLGSTNRSLSGGIFGSYTRSITVPSGLVSGATYVLGYIVDYDSRFGEYVESNNATFVARRIRIC